MWYFNSSLKHLDLTSHRHLSHVPEGAEAFVLGQLHQACPQILHVARTEAHALDLLEQLKILCPDMSLLFFPNWDCLPYDRSSPKRDILGLRVKALTELEKNPENVLVLTSLSSFIQRVPPRMLLKKNFLFLEKNKTFHLSHFEDFVTHHGYLRVQTVREPGEFAIRGGLVDIFPAGEPFPYRLDLFGDVIESLKSFDPLTQRSLIPQESLFLTPAEEVILNSETISCFRQRYRATFGHTGDKDPLYQSISAGKAYPGMEHWLPLFYDSLETLLDYLPEATISWDSHIDEALKARYEQIDEYYQARKDFMGKSQTLHEDPYYPLPPLSLYIPLNEIEERLSSRNTLHFSSFSQPENTISLAYDARPLLDFQGDKNKPTGNRVEKLIKFLTQETEKPVLLASGTDTTRQRLKTILEQHDFKEFSLWDSFKASSLPTKGIYLIVFPSEHSFSTSKFTLLSEQEILGEGKQRIPSRRKRSDLFISEISSLQPGDLVVHLDHGIGQYQGLQTLTISGIPHDCLCLLYADEDKLFIPVENLEVLSRYGGESSTARLDKLGSTAWQARKAKVKEDLLLLADHLIGLAASRRILKGESFSCSEGLFQEFCSRFPYSETEDQLRVMDEVLEDLKSGRPMDRLVCGDVGFGKTEIALRTAFVVASSGKQVIVIAPTTILCRQLYLNFTERFEGFGLRIEQLSRLVTNAKAKQIKESLEKGHVDIVICTHSAFSPDLHFKDLGLVIVDEEQHFGVQQKERLKELQKNVHILTLTATPIPRTLQLALTGVKDMSLIATPPVDRLAVRTFVLPFDRVILREALLREQYRGGQTYWVCPRLTDLEEVTQHLQEMAPEIKFAVAHGQMSPRLLESVMMDFSEKKFDLLVSTNIIESGLDIPTANTMIIYRSDLFGLSQLYQLRGRIGRSKERGYAYLTYTASKSLSPSALKRFEVIQTLDTLGAGFQLASYDMDIRGAGNLLGKQQSGHIKEVGVELYQQMLEEAIANVKSEALEAVPQETWTPQIHLEAPVLIPEDYVEDLSVRLTLYRRLSRSQDELELQELLEEMTDRFGPPPQEVQNLISVIRLKQTCRQANIEKVEAGAKGVTLSFYKNQFTNPARLIEYIQNQRGLARLRPDQKLVFLRPWEKLADRIEGVQTLLKELAQMARQDA